MNIAIITSEYPTHNNMGGIATFTHLLAILLKSQGHCVFVLTDFKNIDDKTFPEKNITIIPFIKPCGMPILRFMKHIYIFRKLISFFQEHFPTTSALIWFNIAALVTFRSLNRHQKIDLIHTPVLYAVGYLTSLFFSRIPLISHAQGPDELLQPYNKITLDSKIKVFIETHYMKRADFIIACSKSVQEYIVNKYRSIKSRVFYIPNFIDSTMHPLTTKTPDTNLLIFLGRLEYRKGPDLVLSAYIKLSMKRLFRLIFIGEDTQTWNTNGTLCLFSDYVRSFELPSNIQKNITFIPRIDERQKLLKFLGSHPGIAVLPSRYEPFGFVYIEAMMAGCITIASKNGGGTEIIRHNIDGYTINPNFEDIVSSVERIKKLSDKNLSTMVKHARQRILNTYDISRITIDYSNLYHKVQI